MKLWSIARLLAPAAALLLLTHISSSAATVQAQTGACEGAHTQVQIGAADNTLTSGGEERFYITYVPEAYDSSKPTALVFTLHGFAGNAAQQEEYSGWDEIAERENFIVVHPQGTGFPLRWQAYQHDMGYMDADEIDDVQFFRDMIDVLTSTYCIDPARIYVNGLSNGGGMTSRLACDLSDTFAAVGIVAGALPAEDVCEPVRPVPVIAFHGTDDPIVPYEGVDDIAGVETWVAAWADRNGCDPVPGDLPTEGSVTGVEYTDCDEGASVVFYTVNGGGHTWPDSPPLPEFITGTTTTDVNATELIWAFFVAHPME